MTPRQRLLGCAVLWLGVCEITTCGGGSSPSGGGGGGGAPTITSVSVSCFSTILQTGQTDQCTPNVQGTGSFSSAVSWTATAGNVSPVGAFTDTSASGQVTITATSTADPTKSGSAKVTVNTAQKSGFAYEGITHTSFQASQYNSTAGTTSQDALATTGAKWAGVLVTWYQADKNATTIAATANSPSDAAVVAAISELHNKGLKVMLKPHVDATSGDWRGTFTPTDVNAWFASFAQFIAHYAALAQQNNVEMLCFGTEYVKLSGAANLNQWLSIITDIRAVYPGLIAYAANATYAGDEFTAVSFWDKVDVIGLDAYFPLTAQSDPTVAQLVTAWSMNANRENVVASVANFASAHPTKPVIFTEIGYRSVAGTNTQPYNFTLAGAVDDTEQQNCYEAMYEVWSKQTALMKGNFWWSWSVPPPVLSTDTDYTPWNKPAQTILQGWQ